MAKVADYVIIGSGVVGVSIGSELLRRNPKRRVVILEKEPSAGLHASGRNSGVIHAGFYYSPDSLKARLTRDGNSQLREFAKGRGLRIQNSGKVVVAQNAKDVPKVHDLYSRGIANGVEVEVVTALELQKLEPLASTHEVALWSPNTGVGDPMEFMSEFTKEFLELGGEISYGTLVKSVDDNRLDTSAGEFHAGHIINASGLYAEKIAAMFGFGSRYTMLPFLGLYIYAPKLKGTLKRHIYPTPDPRNPFLGVHLTTTVDGSVKVGPTAIPVLSREQYSLTSGFNAREFLEILGTYPKFALSPHHDFLSLLRTELPKLSRRVLVRQAKKLAPSIKLEDFTQVGKPGIRAQLFDLKDRKLEMDFVVEGDADSTHVLNAVSPAWTSCISFSKFVVDQMQEKGAA
jgi:(S)-2-hydroxyglutarate dehydrogenase